jgi:hypothetical protein
MTHITPINDIFEHTESTKCPCKPKVEGERCVHNAHDHREHLERACNADTPNESLNAFANYQMLIWMLVEIEKVSGGWAREKTKDAYCLLFIAWKNKCWSAITDIQALEVEATKEAAMFWDNILPKA